MLINWVYPLIITEDDVVCEACRDLAIAAVNENLQGDVDNDQQASSSHRGHTHVCLLCGCSILQRQSDIVLRDNPSEVHQSMIDIIRNKVAPRQVTVSDRVCHACWLRTQREARRINIVDNTRLQPDVKIEDTQEEHQPPVQPESESSSNIERVVLPDYRRAANSNNHCVFPNCISTTLPSISDKLRAIVLHSNKYYLPKLARVCGEHSLSNSWDSLYNSQNSMDSFSIDQIQHVFSFVNTFNPTLDF